MKILVTGGAGFIGSSLCESLLKEGHQVTCFDNLSSGSMNYISNLKNNFTFVKGDCNKFDNLKRLFVEDNFDWVFHYAAVVGVDRTLQKPLHVMEDLKGIMNVLELSRMNNVKKVLFASSSEVYGEPVEIPEVEDGHVNAKLPYAVTKLAGEKLFHSYFEEVGLKTTCLRFFNVYGPRQDSSPYGFVVGIFITQSLNNQPPTVFGDGTQTRDFVYIEDNTKASILAMKSDKTSGESINIGTGRPITILDLAEKIIHKCGKNFEPKLVPIRRLDVKHRFPDISKMRRLLNHRCMYDLDKGLDNTIEWYRNNV